MKRILMLVAMAWQLAACTAMTAHETAKPKEDVTQEAASPEHATTSASHAETENLPTMELSPGLLYQLLVGEVSAQRGELKMSAHAYYQAADYTRDPRLARRATQVAVYANEYATALKAASLWEELSPATVEAQQSLAALLIRQGRTDEAILHLEKLLNLSPEGQANGFMLVNNVLASEPNKQRALQIMANLVTAHEDDPEAVLAYARLAYQADNYALAMEQTRHLLEKQADHPHALALQASILRKIGRIEEALAAYQRALEILPRDTSLRFGYARMLIELQRWPEARKQFKLLDKHLPNNSEVIFTEGLLAVHVGDLEQAEKNFLQLLKLNQRTDDAAYALGQIAESRQRPDDALHWYQQVNDGNSYLDAIVRSSVLISQLKGLEMARAYLRTAELQTPEQEIRLRLVEGELLYEAGQQEEARQVYNEGLEQFPDDIELLYARAMNAENMGLIDELENDLRAILMQEPDNFQALNALGYTLADRTDRYQEAYALISRALELRPDDAAIMDSMGWVLYRLGRWQEAEEFLRRALDQYPDAEIAAHLGEVLWVQGRQDEARQIWLDALEREPGHALLQQVIKRFTQ
ncbi:MAG: tetratricopeptide repeat protein [Thiohalomonadaceae bacterium]